MAATMETTNSSKLRLRLRLRNALEEVRTRRLGNEAVANDKTEGLDDAAAADGSHGVLPSRSCASSGTRRCSARLASASTSGNTAAEAKCSLSPRKQGREPCISIPTGGSDSARPCWTGRPVSAKAAGTSGRFGGAALALKGWQIALTGFGSRDTAELSALAVRCGAIIVCDIPGLAALAYRPPLGGLAVIAKDGRTTAKFLVALALGVPPVSRRWLEQSAKAEHPVSAEAHALELRGPIAAGRGWSKAMQPHGPGIFARGGAPKAAAQVVLHGARAFCATWTDVLRAAGAEVVCTSLKASTPGVVDYVMAESVPTNLSKEEARVLARPGVRVVGLDWLKVCLSSQQEVSDRQYDIKFHVPGQVDAKQAAKQSQAERESAKTSAAEKTARGAKEELKNVKKEPLKNVKKEELKNVKKEPLKNVKKEELKNVKKEPLKSVKQEPLKNVKKELVEKESDMAAVREPDEGAAVRGVKRKLHEQKAKVKQEAPAKKAPTAPARLRLKRGAVVRVQGLKGAKELNGREGLVVGSSGDRWVVHLDGDAHEDLRRVKKDNMQVTAETCCCLCGPSMKRLKLLQNEVAQLRRCARKGDLPPADVIRGIADMELKPLKGCSKDEHKEWKKKLTFKWHPDKAPSQAHAALATEIMQEMQIHPNWHL
eukprot:gnl/TRDRNA2_/TRDRNA2_45277_c0_seq1.p1 gnl/TRDRNA2_/TRDRNA2_45277_c0~~gnl/TRDRNA2_/TRDRNA2_45277_c0_seq1.p1  ORF type:complete len:656 (-),score=159.87 gnl/TRDRNA2_/TRDRNA2_45277_c0_seq1:42-2009(-)